MKIGFQTDAFNSAYWSFEKCLSWAQKNQVHSGIAVSHCPLGGGVNADNICQCITVLRDAGYEGVLSIESEGQSGPMIEQSLAWLRKTLAE